MRYTKIALIVMAFSLCARNTEAERRLPPLTRQSAVGVWEAIIPDDVRVLTMEIRDSKSVVAMSVGRTHPVTTLFDVSTWAVGNGNHLSVHAVGINTTDQLVVSGTGRAVRDDGRIDADIVLKDAYGHELNRWRTIFVELGGRYFETLIALARDGREHIVKLRGK